MRSDGPEDPNNSLWSIRPGEPPKAVFDASGARDDNLTDAEKARRERMREQASGVVSYSARPDNSEVVFALGGGLHRVDVESGQSTSVASDGNAFDPMFEPQGDRIAYASGSTLRVSSGHADAAVPGMEDSDPLISWGSAEFVAAEEMGRGRGYWWAPDGGRLAVCRVDTSPVEEWWIASPDKPSARPRSIRYPAAGTANADVQLWIVDIADGPQVQVDWRCGEFEYLANVEWGETLRCTVQSRDQRTFVVLDADPLTGQTTEILRVEDDHWVELMANSPLRSAVGLLTVVDDVSRRIAIDGVPLDHGDVMVRDLIGVFEQTIVATVTTDGTDSILAKIGIDGAVEMLTSPGAYAAGVYNAGTLVTVLASPDADTTYSIDWASGASSSVESHASAPGFICTPEFFVVGDRALNVALCLPADHDGSPLPVLLDPYGGPHAQRVLRARNAYATSQWFAEQGFAVVVVDGRGTPGRGPAFEREIYGDFATKVLEDQVDALAALALIRPELDLGRVGIRGWSFGGYLAALAVMRRPDVVHAAIAGAPVTDWKLYDTHYTERYLGHPETVPAHYEQSGLITDAPNLDRPLMLIHGLADDNVVAAHTLTLSQALLEAGRPHEVLPLSGVTHMTPQEQVAENLLHLQRDFLHTHLGTRSA
ncbi:MAG: dipeptidyl-peptidase-4 [Verrucomicrobiales bacterium]